MASGTIPAESQTTTTQKPSVVLFSQVTVFDGTGSALLDQIDVKSCTSKNGGRH
jgi:hypothetical protein